MNYVRLLVILSIVWVVIILLFSYALGPNESFHLAHYFWLLVAAGMVIWWERRKERKRMVVGNPL